MTTENMRSKSGTTLQALAEHLGIPKDELRAAEAARSLTAEQVDSAKAFCEAQKLDMERRQAAPSSSVVIKVHALSYNNGELSNRLEVLRNARTETRFIPNMTLLSPRHEAFSFHRCGNDAAIEKKVDTLRLFYEKQGLSVSVIYTDNYCQQRDYNKRLRQDGWRIM